MADNCKLIQDLIPLYVEGLTSEDSSKFVEEHIAQCSSCKEYLEQVKQDYASEPIKQSAIIGQQFDDVMKKLAKYQERLKLVGVLIAMLMSAIVTGAEVQFISTIPFLFLTPFMSRLYYNKSLPIILSSIPFGIFGGVLSEHHSSYISFFTILFFLFTIIGVGSALIIKQSIKRIKIGYKLFFVVPAVALIIYACFSYFSFFGNPVGYIETYIKVNKYVEQTYSKGELNFIGVMYDQKMNSHYGKFDYTYGGYRQEATIDLKRNGRIIDNYKFILEMHFTEERSKDLKAELAAAVDYMPLSIYAQPETELNISRDELDSNYYHLSYDLPRRDKATKVRAAESEKLNYVISFGTFEMEYLHMTKEEFLDKSIAILKALQEREVPFNSVEIKAFIDDEIIQYVTFNKGATEQVLINSYETHNLSKW